MPWPCRSPFPVIDARGGLHLPYAVCRPTNQGEIIMDKRALAVAAWFAFAAGFSPGSPAQAQAPAPRTLKMQSTWPASITLQEHFKIFAERLEKLTSGSLKIEAMAAGQIVPPFEVLDATRCGATSTRTTSSST